MINVIKHGVEPKNQKLIYIWVCDHCTCTFEFELEDCLSIEKRLNGKIEFECPDCHKVFNVSRDIVPTKVVEKK